MGLDTFTEAYRGSGTLGEFARSLVSRDFRQKIINRRLSDQIKSINWLHEHPSDLWALAQQESLIIGDISIDNYAKHWVYDLENSSTTDIGDGGAPVVNLMIEGAKNQKRVMLCLSKAVQKAGKMCDEVSQTGDYAMVPFLRSWKYRQDNPDGSVRLLYPEHKPKPGSFAQDYEIIDLTFSPKMAQAIQVKLDQYNQILSQE